MSFTFQKLYFDWIFSEKFCSDKPFQTTNRFMMSTVSRNHLDIIANLHQFIFGKVEFSPFSHKSCLISYLWVEYYDSFPYSLDFCIPYPSENRERERFLNWSARLKVAFGSARGLAYLHHDCSPKIIHRDIKSSNILLDENFEPHVSDFGLAKLLVDEDAHVTTVVAGTFGYLAPGASFY